MAHRISETDLRVKWLIDGQEGVEKTFEKQRKDIADWTKKVDEAKAALAKLTMEGKAGTDAYKDQAKVLAQNEAALNKSKQGLESLYRQQKLTTMNMAELQRHIKVTNNELKYTDPGSDKWIKLSRELKATKDRLKELSDQSAATQGALGKLSKIRVGTIAVIHSVSSAVRGVSKAIGTIADFEQANANLSTIIGKNVDDIGMLTESAKQLGATTEYTASQVTFLQTELAKLGFKENGVVMLSKIEKMKAIHNLNRSV